MQEFVKIAMNQFNIVNIVQIRQFVYFVNLIQFYIKINIV